MTIYKETKTGRPRGIHYDLSGKTYDPELERMGRFFVERMPEGVCTFERFMENPAWAYSVYQNGAIYDNSTMEAMK